MSFGTGQNPLCTTLLWLWLWVGLSLVSAQPLTAPARITRAIVLADSDIYLYGGSSTSGECFSDLYTLRLDFDNGWVDGNAPWTRVEIHNQTSESGLTMNFNSWAVSTRPSDDGKPGLFVYGQTLCPDKVSSDLSARKHTFSSSSASALLKLNGPGATTATQSQVGNDVLGPRLVYNDDPIPVQVVDQEKGVVYTFVYDAAHPELGLKLYSFKANKPGLDIAHTAESVTLRTAFLQELGTHNQGFHNITEENSHSNDGDHNDEDHSHSKRHQLNKRQDKDHGETNSSSKSNNTDILAPFVDVGSAVFLDGKIIVIGGGRISSAQDPVAVDSDPTSGFYKMDRCWIYDVDSNTWERKMLKTDEKAFPFPRRLAALIVVGKDIYMYGGNTTETIATDTYSNDLWILDTEKWIWSSRASSSTGRAAHTLVRFKDLLISVSGFTYKESPFRESQNSPLLIYNTTSKKWTSDFGKPSVPFLKKNAFVLIIAGVVAVLILLLIASLLSRLWRKYQKNKLARAAGVKKVGPDRSLHKTRFKPFSRPAWQSRKRPSISTTESDIEEDLELNVDRRNRASDSTVVDMNALSSTLHAKQESEESAQEGTRASQVVPLMNDDELGLQEQQRRDEARVQQRQQHG